jgi:hypothetical protein
MAATGTAAAVRQVRGPKPSFAEAESVLRPAPTGLSGVRALSGSLPLDIQIAMDGETRIRPVVMFAPVHLRAAQPVPLHGATAPSDPGIASTSSAMTGTGGGNSGGGGGQGAGGSGTGGAGGDTGAAGNTGSTASGSNPSTNSGHGGGNKHDDDDGSGVPQSETPLLDARFLEIAGDLLADPAAGTAATTLARAADASYDFEQYVLLRERDDPIVQAGYPPKPIPADPRYDRFVTKARSGIAGAVEYALLPFGAGALQLGGPASVLADQLYSWWASVCGVRAFNRLARYNPDDIAAYAWSQQDKSPEGYYGACLGFWLMSFEAADMSAYLGGTSNAIDDLFTVAYWEGVLDAVFDAYFTGLGFVDPSAPVGAYPFTPFPADEIVFGLRIIHRQSWRQLAFARGDLVGTVALGPRENKKVSVKTTRRTKTAQTTEEAREFETSGEATSTSRDTSEVVNEATSKLNRHADAEVGGGYPPFFSAKISAGISDEAGRTSKQTKTNLNEMMEKTASRMKRDTKVSFSTEGETTFEQVGSAELTNPNDEVAITYLYHRLQQRFWVSTQIDEVNSVVFVPEPIPNFWEIDESWIREHGETIAAALLDPSFGGTVAAIRAEPASLSYPAATVFARAADAAIQSTTDFRTFSGAGDIPDMLGSGQQYFEKDFERRATLTMSQGRRAHTTTDLISHIRRNILHYMRAIWSAEDPDQRMQRYSRLRVPVMWTFVPRTPLPAGANGADRLDIDGVFLPNLGSQVPLDEVVDPVGPIGFLFNCAIWRVRDDPRLGNLHQALAHLRAAYTRFSVTVTLATSSNLTVRQAVAIAPRRFSSDYTITWRTARGKWLIPVPGKPEIDWIEVNALPDGSLDVQGIHVWLDGSPPNGETATVAVRATGDLEDPHIRLVMTQYPLPPAALEAAYFGDAVLEEMANLFQWPPPAGKVWSWSTLSADERREVRRNYHGYLMLRESGRLVTIDTANLVLDLEVGRSAALEPFKRLHRYIDVMKENEEMRRRQLENTRRTRLLTAGRLADPEIERVAVAAGPPGHLDDLVILDGDDK